ncbi:MAG: hypothetical protein EXR71_05270 [Myxococcales bacterium]|nr:hypothetical protein [Myxococcales bacterium]
MGRGVIVGLGGVFLTSAAVRRRWADVAAIAPLATRLRGSVWLSPLPKADAVTGAMRALGGHPGTLVGQPGAVAAAGAWGRTLGLPGDGPLVALLGASDVEAAIDEALAAGRRVGVACGTDGGEPIEPPPGGVWIEDAWAGEGTRGVLGAGVLVAAGLAGLDVGAALAGAKAMRESCQAPITENPAWSLARALRGLAQEGRIDVVAHVAGEPALAAFAAWAARAQATMLARPSPTHPARPLPVHFLEGDQEWLHAISEGRDRVLLVWETGTGVLPRALHEGSLTRIRVQLPGLDAEALAGAFVLWLRALEFLAALEDRGA